MGQRRRMLTVILTSRDRFELLRSAIASVYAQTYKEWELVIADDDSKDPRIHELYAQLESDPYVSILRGAKVPEKYRKNHKMNAVRINSAIQLANGRYITYLSDDNVWLTTRCEKMMNVFKENPAKVDVVVNMARWVTWDGRKFPQDHFQYRYATPFEKGHEKLLKIIAPSNFIVNDCVIQKSPRRCSKCEHWPVDHTHTPVDWRYWLKLLNDGKRFVKLNEVGTVAYFPGTWKTATVKQALNHRQEPMEVVMSKKLKRRARVEKEKREKKKGKGNQDRWCVNTGTCLQQWTHPETNKFMTCEPGGRVRESAIKLPNGGIFPGFAYESIRKPKPLKEVLNTKPAKPQDFGFEAVDDDSEIEIAKEDIVDEAEIKDESKVMPVCSKCGKPISLKSKTGLCRKHYNESRKKK